jgi:hypothetical protein
MKQRWNGTDRGKLKDSEKTCPSATPSTTNPIWTDLGAIPGPDDGGSKYLWNVGTLVPDYTAQQARRLNILRPKLVMVNII